MKEASTVFLAAPVEQTLHMLDELAASGIKKSCSLQMSAARNKGRQPCRKVLPDDYRFIGGHPMAGSHKSGVAAAKDFLSRTRLYLTPSGSAGKEAVASLKDLLKGTNAKFVEMSPAEHDAVTSVISHFRISWRRVSSTRPSNSKISTRSSSVCRRRLPRYHEDCLKQPGDVARYSLAQ
ncbi:prephenate dehydrogenase/arogenate dehydrogenase family protein [Bacillus licheniformis]|nr:prephenate dehydrogenase/arogenate dehydrogenase family protein [Bacillus licheniformis]